MISLFQQYLLPLIIVALKVLSITIPLLLCVAYLTYAERRVIGLMQLRKGPNVVGYFGLLQPIADAVKLLFKETIIPNQADKILFTLAPMITFVLSLIGWAVIPFDKTLVLADINVGVLYIMAISSLGVYGIIIAGWASNSKYAFLGAIRSSAQMISYEVSIGLVIVTVLLTTGTLNLSEIIERQQLLPWWVDLMLSPMAVIFFISLLVETNRLPFDLSEAESELVAGYNVEYSSMGFALFFLGEYANMILASSMTTTFFLGGYLPPFGIKFLNFVPGFIWFIVKIGFLLFCFLWIRATLPRYRYDQLMRLGWKVFLPFTLFWVVLISSVLMFTGNLPN
ncbi:MAG: NADH-quinone oxidoreductase subunit NuoH [Rickettsia endosymbiont of Pseudomimeciton antennatum]|nr:NADH-quinone oxidoreductase subunit NuoH [Rickettsia endosymbiont of Pseudomimeciton antennatum]MCC8397758.1 NADH-quinone oxidoreductase subunit NuoH [Rickettsia endosymbiont of Labidopullus appendiculatus]